MPYADPEKRKQFYEEYRKKNAAELKRKGEIYRKNNREKIRAQNTAYRQANREWYGVKTLYRGELRGVN